MSLPDPAEVDRLEQALATWQPRELELDRAQLLFAAGRAAGRAELAAHGQLGWLWPAATALSTAAALLVSFLLWQARSVQTLSDKPGETTNQFADLSPPREESVAHNPVPLEPLPSRRGTPRILSESGSYLALRDRMLLNPADAWSEPRRAMPTRESNDHPPRTMQDLLEELLPTSSDEDRNLPPAALLVPLTERLS